MTGRKSIIETPHEVWVIDTSSIIAVRRERVPRAARPQIFRALTDIVVSGALVFPHEVLGELERAHPQLKPGSTDEPFDWAKEVHETACRHGTDFAAVKKALEIAPTVLDKDKVAGADEADPYILGLALALKAAGHEVTVVSEERKDHADKMSIATACGLLRLYSLPLIAFLQDRGIWTPE